MRSLCDRPKHATTRNLLGGVLAFSALNAIAGGYYGLSGAEGVPKQWLEGSPFNDYFIPSLVLLIVVGGAFVISAIAVFMGLRIARRAALSAGVIVLGWLAVQMAIIGYVSWMQPTTAVAGLLIIVLARSLGGRARTTVARSRLSAVRPSVTRAQRMHPVQHGTHKSADHSSATGSFPNRLPDDERSAFGIPGSSGARQPWL